MVVGWPEPSNDKALVPGGRRIPARISGALSRRALPMVVGWPEPSNYKTPVPGGRRIPARNSGAHETIATAGVRVEPKTPGMMYCRWVYACFAVWVPPRVSRSAARSYLDPNLIFVPDLVLFKYSLFVVVVFVFRPRVRYDCLSGGAFCPGSGGASSVCWRKILIVINLLSHLVNCTLHFRMLDAAPAPNLLFGLRNTKIKLDCANLNLNRHHNYFAQIRYYSSLFSTDVRLSESSINIEDSQGTFKSVTGSTAIPYTATDEAHSAVTIYTHNDQACNPQIGILLLPYFAPTISSSHPIIKCISTDIFLSSALSDSDSDIFQIFIHLSTKTFTVSVSENDSILTVKRTFLRSSKSSMALHHLRFFHHNIFLHNHLSVKHYAILPGTTIRSGFQLLGGSDSDTDQKGDTKDLSSVKHTDFVDCKPSVSGISTKPSFMVGAKPTKFFLDDMQSPETWLLTIETTYGERGLVSSRDRFNFLLPLIPVNYMSKLSSIVKLTTETSHKHPYSAFREAFVRLLQPTKSTLFSIYFRDQILGDLLPSKFLAKCKVDLDSMQKGASGDEAMLRRFFLSALPVQHQQILSVLPTATIAELALSADKLAEIAQSHLTASVDTCSGESNRSPSMQTFDTSGLIAAITTLTNQNAELSRRIHGLETTFQRSSNNDNRPSGNFNQASASPRGNSFSRSRSPSPSNQRQPLLCSYHYRFGDNAQYCHLGCQAQNISASCKRLEVCVYHARFKRGARNCVTGCKFNTANDATVTNANSEKNT